METTLSVTTTCVVDPRLVHVDKAELEELRRSHDKLAVQRDMLNTRIVELRAEATEWETKYEVLVRDTVEPLRKEVKALSDLLAIKDEEIRSLEEKIQGLENSIERVRAAASEEVASLRTELYAVLAATPESSEREEALGKQLTQLRIDTAATLQAMDEKLAAQAKRATTAETDLQKLQQQDAILTAGTFAVFVSRSIVSVVIQGKDEWQVFLGFSIQDVKHAQTETHKVDGTDMLKYPLAVKVYTAICELCVYHQLSAATLQDMCGFIGHFRNEAAHGYISVDDVTAVWSSLQHALPPLRRAGSYTNKLIQFGRGIFESEDSFKFALANFKAND